MADMNPEKSLRDLLPHVIGLAREAGSAVVEVYNSVDPKVEYKKDNSPLTQADIVSHGILVNGLQALVPEWPVLSEESSEIAFVQRAEWHNFWLVDPLDGTKEFLKRNGEFTVNIALIEGGTPILGVVYAPAIEKLYYAARGTGAFKTEGDATKRIQTAKRVPNAVRVVMSRSHGAGEESLEQFTGGAVCEFVSMGSSLKFCLVAEGTADIYPRSGPTMEWDTAAAQCVVEEAGGMVTDLQGNAMTYNKQSLLNPGFVAIGDREWDAVGRQTATPTEFAG